MTPNYTATLNEAVMNAVAKRIATTQRTDPEAARNDYEQSIQPMDANEREAFESAIVRFVIEMS
jgi:hypothetical protein